MASGIGGIGAPVRGSNGIGTCGKIEAMKHGQALKGKVTSEYSAWHEMRRRCCDPSRPRWIDYGGRGIKICERWRHNFAAFFQDMGPKPKGRYSLDRINNDGDYEPKNCRWATQQEQMQNTRHTRRIQFNGETLALSEWARRLGLPILTLHSRLVRDGWSVERALTTAAKKTVARTITFNGQTRTITAWAHAVGMKPEALYSRLDIHGWPIEKALTVPVRRYITTSRTGARS